jgi:hypothetical protein
MYLLSGQPKLIFQKGQIEIEYLEDHKTLNISWSGHISNEDYRFVLQQLLKYICKLEIENLLVDARESESVDRGNWNWTIYFFLKQLARTPLKRIARIGCGYLMKEAKISRLITETHKKHPLPICFRYVSDINSALEWFKESDIQPGIKNY